MELTPDHLVRYEILRKANKMGRLWIFDQYCQLASIDAPPLYEHKYTTEISRAELADKIDEEWKNRPMELFT